jgi:hypothetical protein
MPRNSTVSPHSAVREKSPPRNDGTSFFGDVSFPETRESREKDEKNKIQEEEIYFEAQRNKMPRIYTFIPPDMEYFLSAADTQ